MENKPVVQNFLGKPIRFYKTKFQLEIRGHNAPQPFTIETYAIPFPDYCRAIGKPEKDIRRMIQLSDEVFKGMYRNERIPDALGRSRNTMVMCQEMVDGLTMKLHASRIDDEQTRNQVIDFQRFIMLTIGLIRRGKLKMTHDLATSFACPPDYQNLLMLPSGRDLKRAVGMVADKEGVSAETVYRKLRRLRGSNVINARGVPRKQRAA